MRELECLMGETATLSEQTGCQRRPAGRTISERIQFELMVETLAAGSLGREKCERDRIVEGFCRAAQLFGAVGERRLLDDLNGGLKQLRSTYRLRLGDLKAPTPGARALEVIDLRVDMPCDRMIFGILLINAPFR